MNQSSLAFAGVLLLAVTTPLQAQSVNAGRGEVPVTVPASWDQDAPAPLIVLLHGYTSSGARHDAYFGMSDIADEYGFLLLAPDGNREEGGDWNRFWNGSDACCDLERSGVDDVGYILALIDAVSEQWSVDPLRVYLVGHSNGGFMSYRIAYEHPERIAAIASLAGAAQGSQRPPPAAPVNILQIHGTADEVIRYGGGEIGENRYPGASATVAQWARWNGCNREARGREARDLDASLPGHETGALVYVAGCAPGGRVTLWTISSGSHSPRFIKSFAAQIVEWLYAHPKPGD
ncbi:MAG: PHB depolymerase family esterase [Gemmatimonadota bacterium]